MTAQLHVNQQADMCNVFHVGIINEHPALCNMEQGCSSEKNTLHLIATEQPE